jgi:hypothetical protein
MSEMPSEGIVVIAIPLEPINREKPAECQCGINSGTSVTLADNHAITAGIIRSVGVNSQNSAV